MAAPSCVITLDKVIDLPNTDKKKFEAHFTVKDRVTNVTRKIRTKFGESGRSDFTLHKNKKRRESYIRRHAKDLRTGNPTRAGYLSLYLLWGRSRSLKKNIKIFKKTHLRIVPQALLMIIFIKYP